MTMNMNSRIYIIKQHIQHITYKVFFPVAQLFHKIGFIKIPIEIESILDYSKSKHSPDLLKRERDVIIYELLMKRDSIEVELLSILGSIKGVLPVNDVDIAFDFTHHVEYGLALEQICYAYCEFQIEIEQCIYDRLEQLGRRMRMPEKEWSCLKELIKQ